MLELIHVTKKYNDYTILNDISYVFPSIGLIGVVGDSGCGKSTLLHLISGLEKPSQGKILFHGIDINEECESYRQYHCQNVFQHFYLDHHSTVKENIALPLYFNKKKRKGLNQLLVDLEIRSFKNKKVSLLSGGQKQRVALARALSIDPDILLLDEPTSSLNGNLTHTFMKLIKEISKSRLVILVSHDEELIDTYCDSLIKMQDGYFVEGPIFEKEKKWSCLDKAKSLSLANKITLAFKLLIKNKYRFLMSILSLVIGITFILSSFIIKDQVKMYLHNQLSQIFPSSCLSFMYKDRHLMTMNDFKNIKSDSIHSSFFVPSSYILEELTYKDKSVFIEDYTQVASNQTLLKYGRLATDYQEIVMSLPLALDLVNESDVESLVDQNVMITINGKQIEVKVVGITAFKTGLKGIMFIDGGFNELIQNYFNVEQEPILGNMGMLYIDEHYSLNGAKEELETIYSDFEFKIVGQSYVDKVNQVINQVSLTLNLFAIFLIGSSLLLLGVVLYLNVIEENKFIGILLSVGCLRSDVRKIFVIQGLLLVALANMISFILTMGVMNLFIIIFKAFFYNKLTWYFPIDAVLILFIVTLFLGLLASDYPARTASTKNVLDTLKD